MGRLTLKESGSGDDGDGGGGGQQCSMKVIVTTQGHTVSPSDMLVMFACPVRWWSGQAGTAVENSSRENT